MKKLSRNRDSQSWLTDTSLRTGWPTRAEIMNWPDWMWNILVDVRSPGGEDRFQNLPDLSEQVDVNSREFYAGKCSQGTLNCFFNTLFYMHFGRKQKMFHTTHAADSNAVCQSACLCHKCHDEHAPPTVGCVFGEVCDRLKSEARNVVRICRPSDDIPKPERQEQWDFLWEMMKDDPQSFMELGAVSWCSIHVFGLRVHHLDKSGASVLEHMVKCQESKAKKGKSDEIVIFWTAIHALCK